MFLKDAFYRIKKTPLTFEVQQVSKKSSKILWYKKNSGTYFSELKKNHLTYISLIFKAIYFKFLGNVLSIL